MKDTKSPVRAAAAAAGAILGKGDYADRAIEYGLNESRHWTQAEKSLFVTLTYEVVRWLRLLMEIESCPVARGKYLYAIGVYMTLKGIPLDPEDFPEPFDKEKITERLNTLSSERRIIESIPDWLDQMAADELGSTWPGLLSALNKPAPIVLRTNTLKTNQSALAESLKNAGINTIPSTVAEQALLLEEFSNVFTLSLYHNGYFEGVQVLLAQIAKGGAGERVGEFAQLTGAGLGVVGGELRPLAGSGFRAGRLGLKKLLDGLLDVCALHVGDGAQVTLDGFAHRAPLQLGGGLDKLRRGGQQGNPAASGLPEGFETLQSGEGIAGLRSRERGGLGTVRGSADNAFSGGFGVGIGSEGLHPPFARGGVGEAVVSELPARRVDFRLAGAVSDGDGESHATVSGSGEILCKLCANFLRIA